MSYIISVNPVFATDVTNSTNLTNSTVTNSTMLTNSTVTNSTMLTNSTVTNSTMLTNSTVTNSTMLTNSTVTVKATTHTIINSTKTSIVLSDQLGIVDRKGITPLSSHRIDL